MKVLYFGFPSGGRYSGLKTFNLGLIPALQQELQRRGAELILLAADPDLIALQASGLRVEAAPGGGILRENTVLFRRALALGPDVVFFPSSRIPFAWSESAPPAVATFHDLLFFRFPKRMAFPRRVFRTIATRRLLARAAGITAVSEFTRGELRDFGYAGPATVISEGATYAKPPGDAGLHLARMRARWRLPDAYYLFLGSQTFQKNLPALARAYGKYREGGGNAGLVVAGFPGNDSGRWRAALARLSPLTRELVRDLGPVSDEDRAALYHGARAVVMPSLYEGFGLPVLEALAFGKIVLFGGASLPEIAGSAGIPAGTEPESIAAAMRRLESEPELVVRCDAQRLDQLSRFTWQRTASALAGVIAQVAEGRSRRWASGSRGQRRH